MILYIYIYIYIHITIYHIWSLGNPGDSKISSHECRMKMATFEARRPRGMAHQFIEGIKMDHCNFCVPNSQGLYGILTLYI